MWNYFVIVVVFNFFLAAEVKAGVFINEFTPDSSPQKVEIINTSSSSANISNWHIDDSGGSTFFTIPSETFLYPNSCRVFEGNFNFNKITADTVRLFNEKALPTDPISVLIDSFSYDTSPGYEISYARSPDGAGTWTSEPSSMGLFNGTADSCLVYPTATPTPTPPLLPTLSVTAIPLLTEMPITPTSIPIIRNIFINEVYPYPDLNEKEWIELYNNNDIGLTIQDWYMDDVENGGSTPRRFSMYIPAYGYRIIEYPSSLFNNDFDTVRLLDQDKNEVDGFEYSSPQQAKSFGREKPGSETICIQNPSKESVNYGCLTSSSSQDQSSKSISSTVSVSLSGVSGRIPYSDEPLPQGFSSIYYSQPEVLGAAANREKEPIFEI